MTLQPFAFQEFRLNSRHDAVFFRRQFVGVLRINRRKIRRRQLVGLTVQRNRTLLPVNFVEHQAVVHIVFRMADDDLPFQLAQNDVNRLYHRLDAVVLFIGI